MNKNAIAFAEVAIVLGLLVIAVMGMVFAPKLANQLQEWFTGVKNLTQPHPGTIHGTTSGGQETLVLMPEGYTDGKNLLADIAVQCYNAMTKAKLKVLLCATIEPKTMSYSISKEEYDEILSTKGPIGQDLAGTEWLDWRDYFWEIEKPLTKESKPFYLCGTKGNQIILTRTLTPNCA